MLDIYYDFRSPFVLLALEPVGVLERRFSITAKWYPLRLPELASYADRPMGYTAVKRNAYVTKDLARWAALRGITIKAPAVLLEAVQDDKGKVVRGGDHPLDTEQPLRIAAILSRLGTPEQLNRFNDIALRMLWSEGINLAEPAAQHELLRRVDIDPQWVADNEETACACLTQYTHEADERGVFGVPTFFVGDEMFWGNDRLDFVEREIEKQIN